MSLMSGLYVGTSGLQTSQNALNTTAHNLSNIETQGYVRQQVLMADKFYNNIGQSDVSKNQVGFGVQYDKVRQVRDTFLDKSYRMESGRSGFYEIQSESISEIETLLGEFDGVAFQESLGDLWTQVQELAKDPSSSVVQGSLINTAAQFIERAQAVYNGLCDYQDNLNARVEDYVKRINDLGDKINNLNRIIMHEESNTVSEANDYRDEMNGYIDELAGLVNISYFTNVDGATEIQIEGVTFVSRDQIFHMGTELDKDTGFIDPVWPHYEEQKVFYNQLSREICSANNTDIGELKSLIYARGDRRGNYTDLEEPYFSNVQDPTGVIDGMWTATETSVIIQVQAELDNLIHYITSEINNIVMGEKAQIDKYYETGDINDLPTYTEAEYANLPEELFVRLGSNRYEAFDDGGVTKYRYIPENTSNPHVDVSTMYTTANLKINPKVVKEPALLAHGFISQEDMSTVQQSIADELVQTFNKNFSVLNPNLTQELNCRDYYASLVGQVGTDGSIYATIVDAQQVAINQLDDSRQSVMGVSSNEELTNMIKYQNAYNASSRFITAVNEMLESMMDNLS